MQSKFMFFLRSLLVRISLEMSKIQKKMNYCHFQEQQVAVVSSRSFLILVLFSVDA